MLELETANSTRVGANVAALDLITSELTSAERAIVADYWWQRAEGEMTSWVGFGHVLADLRALGANAAVLELAERAVADEWRHAYWCRDWARAFGRTVPDEVAPRTTRPVSFSGASEHLNRLLRIALCCFTESVGCFVLREARPHIRWPLLRRQNQRHLADELQHSRVGWGYLSSVAGSDKLALAQWIPRLLELLPEACVEGPEADHEPLVAWGYFTPRLLARAHEQALNRVIVPGLEHLGLRGLP